VERGVFHLGGVVDSRARVEQQDCCVTIARLSGDVQWGPAVGWQKRVDVGTAFEKMFYGCAPASTSCTMQARRRSIRSILDAHAIKIVGCHTNKRVKVAARSVKAHRLVEERGFSSVHRADDPGCSVAMLIFILLRALLHVMAVHSET
jgi:hypothetical protein